MPLESSSGLTPEFDRWRRRFRGLFTRLLTKEFGAQNIQIHYGHFDVSGFFTMPSGQIYYFNTGDLRLHYGMYIRTAQSYKDYTGGRNNPIPYNSEAEFVEALHRVLDGDMFNKTMMAYRGLVDMTRPTLNDY